MLGEIIAKGSFCQAKITRFYFLFYSWILSSVEDNTEYSVYLALIMRNYT